MKEQINYLRRGYTCAGGRGVNKERMKCSLGGGIRMGRMGREAGRENSTKYESYFEIMRERHNIHMYLCV